MEMIGSRSAWTYLWVVGFLPLGGMRGWGLWKKPEFVCRVPEITKRQSYTTNMLFKDGSNSGRLIIDKSDMARKWRLIFFLRPLTAVDVDVYRRRSFKSAENISEETVVLQIQNRGGSALPSAPRRLFACVCGGCQHPFPSLWANTLYWATSRRAPNRSQS